MPGRSGSEAGGHTSSMEPGTPLSATGPTSDGPCSVRRHLFHSSASPSSCVGDVVPTHDQHVLANAVEVAPVGHGGGQPKQSFLPTIVDTSATGEAAAGVSSLRCDCSSPPEPLMTSQSMSSHVQTPNQFSPVIDTRCVQLLQSMQQMLQNNVPTAMLQQWVSTQLVKATAPTTVARPPTAVVVVPSSSVRPLVPTALSASTVGQPTSPCIPPGSRPARRPAPTVSFSGFGYPHRQVQQWQKMSPQGGSPVNCVKVLSERSFTPPDVGRVCNVSSGSVSSALTSAVDGGAVALASAMRSAAPVAVAVVSKSDIEERPSDPSVSFLTGSAMVPSLERGLCSNVDGPLASGAADNGNPAEDHQHFGGDGVLKTTQQHQQHSQYRSLRNQSSNADCSSPTAPSGEMSSATASITGTAIAPPNVILNSTSPSPASSPKLCSVASSLHSATKAAIHATTSQLLAVDQQNISLLLGERFSRHPQNFLRRVATPLVPACSSVPATSAVLGASLGATFSQGKLHCENDRNAAGGTSCLATANTVLERSDAPTGSSVAPPLALPSVTCSPVKVEERGTRTMVESSNRHASFSSEAAPACGSGLTHKLGGIYSSPVMTPPCPVTTIMDASGSCSSDVSSPQSHYSVNDDLGAVPNVAHDRSDAAVAALTPLPLVAASASLHPRTGRTPSEPTTSAEVETKLKLLRQRGLPSSTFSAVTAMHPLTAAAETASADAVELMTNTEVPGVVSISGVETEDAAVLRTSFRRRSFHTSSSLHSGGDSNPLPRRWGGAAAHDGEHYRLPHRGAPLTLPSVSASTTSFAWTQPPLNMSSPAGASETSLSQLAPLPAAVIQGTHQSSVTLRRATSFVSTTSSHLACGGAMGGHGVATFLNLAGQDSFSLHDDVPSFSSSHTTGIHSVGDGMGDNRRRRFSVLHLSRSSVNGGVDPMNGVMPSFVLDDIKGAQRHSGPRFLRSFCRHTPVRATEKVTREALKELDVLFIEGIDHASVPTNVWKLMDAYRFTDSRSFYVTVCLNVLLRYEFVQRFGWNLQKLKRFFEVAATYFRGGNPFHHPVHAVDIVLAAHQWLNEGSTGAALSDDEAMTFLFTAMVQQLAHTGADNRLLGQLKHPYAMLCSYASPQQGATVALVMALLSRPDLHFFPVPFAVTPSTAYASDVTDPAVVKEWTTSRESQMYDMLADLIMATDERNHATLKQHIMRMGEENAGRHGCMCASIHTDSSSQMDTAMRLPYPSPLGNFCLNCCAYITDAHVPDLLKAVLHFIDFAYLFRPYPVYLSGNIAFIAEVYRQSEQEYQLLQRPLADEADGEKVGEEVLRRWSGAQNIGASFSVSAADARAPAVTFATALLTEQHPWRQGVAQASTMTSLQRGADEVVVTTDTPLPLLSGTDTTLPMEATTHPHTASPPLLALDTQQVTRASQDKGAASSNVLETATRAQPLKGVGRDIVLVSLEDLCLPFLEQLAPYMPEAWVAASYANHQRLMKSLPTPEKFDEIVNRLLAMGEATEAEKLEEDMKKECEIEDEAADLLAAEHSFTLPWLLLRPVCPIAAEWTVDKDGLVRRVVREIMRGPEQLLKASDTS
ncbi:hypothetical protein, conserved [Leishmania tarentolae]|uniref:PDEase domain-containing protein n=1 Tax=Leishmania tarentolae TaxID=5689 RepID=A0A640KD79_LEITA|nr:hypothetical protein, conserved [Leishmania tarentolae]